jgi:hypothetical protein
MVLSLRRRGFLVPLSLFQKLLGSLMASPHICSACFNLYCLFLLLTTVRYSLLAENLNSAPAPDLTRPTYFTCSSLHSLSYHALERNLHLKFGYFLPKQFEFVATERIACWISNAACKASDSFFRDWQSILGSSLGKNA